ncbi:MAG: putative transcriptional regulator [Candidatus Kentron sp. G]|nr:MAG: putative transcriptional regulator [Candidatus Kentron sp. G]VFN01208.1 MAG: putative transcriptional regulator [Candidatus Kentron sp. G]
MNKFSSIKQGLEEAIGYCEGGCTEAAVHEFSPIDVKNIRARMDMTQMEFASAFGIRRLAEKNIPNCAGFSSGFKAQ